MSLGYKYTAGLPAVLAGSDGSSSGPGPYSSDKIDTFETTSSGDYSSFAEFELQDSVVSEGSVALHKLDNNNSEAISRPDTEEGDNPAIVRGNTFQFDFKTGKSSVDIGVQFGGNDEDNCYEVKINTTDAFLHLRSDGSSSSIDTGSVSLSLDTWHTMTITYGSSTISVDINGTTELSASDETYGDGIIGWRSLGMDEAYYDNCIYV